MYIFKSFFNWYKAYAAEFKMMKICVLVIINLWLLVIFWKIIAFNNLSVTNNNIALLKMNTLLQPLLQILGLDLLNPNIIKMIIISFIVIVSNLSILYFSQMMAFLFLGFTARYSYKAYYNYINKDTLNYYGFEKIQNNLSFTEKEEILNYFLAENSITDLKFIELIKDKISSIDFISKNDLILSLNNNWLDYKQQLLNNLISYQKEQISMLENVIIDKASSSWFSSIDWVTIFKLGAIATITIAAAYYGYSYFNNNNAVTAAKDIGKESLNATRTITDAIAESTLKQQNFINELHKESISSLNSTVNANFQIVENYIKNESKINSESLAKVQSEMLNITTDFNSYQDKINNDIIKEHSWVLDNSQGIVNNVANLSEGLFKLSSEVKDINNTIPVLTEGLAKVTSEVSILAAKVDGGTVNRIISTNSDGTSNLEEIASFTPLVGLHSRVDTLHSLLTATLFFMGVDVSNQISKDALYYLEVIRNSTHRNSVYEKLLPSVHLDNVDPVDADLVTNVEQASPFSSSETTVPSTVVNVEFDPNENESDKSNNSKKEKR